MGFGVYDVFEFMSYLRRESTLGFIHKSDNIFGGMRRLQFRY